MVVLKCLKDEEQLQDFLCSAQMKMCYEETVVLMPVPSS